MLRRVLKEINRRSSLYTKDKTLPVAGAKKVKLKMLAVKRIDHGRICRGTKRQRGDKASKL